MILSLAGTPPILGDVRAERAQNLNPDFRITSYCTFTYFYSRLFSVNRSGRKKWVSYFSGFEKENCHLVGVC
jgi:hypothetical protein